MRKTRASRTWPRLLPRNVSWQLRFGVKKGSVNEG